MSTEALQTTLAAEHAALYVFGTLGGRTSQTADPDLFVAIAEAFAAHRRSRDQLTAMIIELGAEPVAAEAAYDVPAGLDRSARIARVAVHRAVLRDDVRLARREHRRRDAPVGDQGAQ